jgi:mannose-6-phosphate isomerase
MFVRLANTPRDYPWGSATAIPELLGTEVTGQPQAELWLGAHPGSPAKIAEPAATGGAADVLAWINSDPRTALGDATQLPFLLKILAAEGPLSLQAHPTLERARQGFAAENAAGVPLDAPNRNYKDALHKPEVIFALSDRFDALCGFRPLDEVRAIVAELRLLDAATTQPTPAVFSRLGTITAGDDGSVLSTVVAWLLSGASDVAILVNRVVAVLADSVNNSAVAESRFSPSYGTVIDLAREYPGDPGIVTSLLLNRVTLRAGEALYLPAGNIHAYLKGLGVELMAASDNVLRGGLTPKHIDVPELLDVLEFSSVPIPYLRPEYPSAGVAVYRPDVPDFVLVKITVELNERAAYRPDGAAIAICTAGSFEIHGETSGTTLQRGEAVFITPDEGGITFSGSGTLFLAAPGSAAAH